MYWDDNDRNTAIVIINNATGLSISFLQGNDNNILKGIMFGSIQR
jgi:hypothetical protein